MTTLAELTNQLKEDNEDQLEVQLEMLTVLQTLEGSILKMTESMSSIFATPDMIKHQVIGGLGDLFTESSEEASLKEIAKNTDFSNSILRVMVSQNAKMSDTLDRIAGTTRSDADDSTEELQQKELEREAGGSIPDKPKSGGSPFSGIMGGIGKMLGRLAKVFKVIGMVAGGVVLSVLAFGDQNLVGKMLDGISSLFTRIVDAITPAFEYMRDNIIPKITEILPTVLDTLALLFEKVIGPLLTNTILPLAEMGLSLLGDFFVFLKDALENPTAVADEFFFKMEKMFLDLGDFVGNSLDKVMISFGTAVNGIIDNIMGSKWVPDFVKDQLGAMKVDVGAREDSIAARETASAARDQKARDIRVEKKVRQSGATGQAAELVRLKAEQQEILKSPGGFNDPRLDEVNRKIKGMESASPPSVSTTASATPVAAVAVPMKRSPSVSATSSVPRAETLPKEVFVDSVSGKFRAYHEESNTFALFSTVSEAEKFAKATLEEAASMDPSGNAAEVLAMKKGQAEKSSSILREIQNNRVEGARPREGMTNQMSSAQTQNSELTQSSANNVVVAPNTSNVNNVSNVQNSIMQDVPSSANPADSYAGLVNGR